MMTHTAPAFAPPAPHADSAAVTRDISTREFLPYVIEDSKNQPVIVDFWAPWCGPCKQLAPVLERVVAATAGKVKLVKMDIDQHPQVAGQMGIKSIPAVYAFYQGQPIDGFMGALPEAQVRSFVDKLLALSGQETRGAVIAELLNEAALCLQAGDVDAANTLYSGILDQEPTNAEAYAGLVKIALHLQQPEEAKAMLEEASAEMQKHPALVQLKAHIALEEKAQQVGGDLSALEAAVTANPDNHEARYKLSLALHAAGQSEAAIDQLIESIKRDKTWNEEAAKKQILVIFEALGVMHDITIAGRRKLSAVLFR